MGFVVVETMTLLMMNPCSSLMHSFNPLLSKIPTIEFCSSISKRHVFSVNCSVSHNTQLPFQTGTQRVEKSPGLTIEKINWPSPNDEIPFWEKSTTCSDATIEVPVNVNKDSNPMHIVHVTAEMAPVAKVGGLGDVVTGLARACLSRGHTVDVMLPFYECLPKQQITELNLICTYNSYHDGIGVPTNAYRAVASGIPVILIEPTNNFFKGQRIYGGSYDELESYLFFSRACLEYLQIQIFESYLFFSRACLEYLQVTGIQPDVIHVHEWQTSALPLLYWDIYHHLSLKKPRIVLTIHNMEHYGECRKEQFGKSGLDGDVYATTDKAVDDRTIGHNPERLSLLKGGIVYSNAVVTVSPSYLKETLGSGWLSSILIKYRDKYNGVLNGIDTAWWNPTTDLFLPAKFDGKAVCKEYVQRGFGLPTKSVETSTHLEDKIPLVVCITRLVAQKGLHLIHHAIKHVEAMGGQMIVLGRASTGHVKREFEDLATLHNQGPNIRILLIYSEKLSHMLYAAADMDLVPSVYEPCGLAQMIGMRYGAVPIVRKTGGLADTVFDMDDQSNQEISNGFAFEGIDERSLSSAMDRAFTFYTDKPDEWQMLVKNMQIDNSWNNAAAKYVSIYNSVRAQC